MSDLRMNSTLEDVLKPHLNDLRKYCNYLTKSKWDGEDLYQETLFKSLVYFTKVEPLHSVKPFLFRVSRNLWIDQCRANHKRGPRIPLDDDMAEAVSDSDYGEVRSLIDWMLARFPRRSIEIWLLSEYFGYTMLEIAEDVHCTVSTVKSVLFRTRQRLYELRGSPLSGRLRTGIESDGERFCRAIMTDNPKAFQA